MRALEKYFFNPLYYPPSSWNVDRWWESRRWLFNLTVGGVGVISLGAVTVFGLLPPVAQHPLPPWPLVLVYGVLANLCYTAGAPADLLLRKTLGPRAAVAGPTLFRYGFVFSLGL